MKLHVFLQITVHGKDGHLICLLIKDSHGLNVSDLIVFFCGMSGTVHNRQKRLAASVLGSVHEGIENGLLPCAACGVCHDGGDHIYKLRKTCHFHTVRVLDQSDEHQAYKQGILKVVDVLQHRRCHLPRMVFRDIIIRCIGVEPHIPFVKAQIHDLFAAFFSFHIVAGGDDSADKVIHIIRLGQIIIAVIVPVAVILVHGNVIHIIICMGQCHCLPVREGGHIPVGASAGYQFNAGVNEPHSLCRFLSQTSVLFHGLVANLPRTVHLIAQAPYFNVVRIFYAVADTQVTVFCP